MASWSHQGVCVASGYLSENAWKRKYSGKASQKGEAAVKICPTLFFRYSMRKDFLCLGSFLVNFSVKSITAQAIYGSFRRGEHPWCGSWVLTSRGVSGAVFLVISLSYVVVRMVSIAHFARCSGIAAVLLHPSQCDHMRYILRYLQ